MDAIQMTATRRSHNQMLRVQLAGIAESIVGAAIALAPQASADGQDDNFLAMLEMLQQQLIDIQIGLGYNNFWIDISFYSIYYFLLQRP